MPALHLSLSKAELEKLSYERYYFPQPKIQKRITAVYFKALLDCSNQHAALLSGLHENNAALWISIYRKEGFEGLLRWQYKGRTSELHTHVDPILDDFDKEAPHSLNEAAARIHKLTGIQRSLLQVRNFLHRWGYTRKKCGHVPSGADGEKQQAFIDQELTPAIKAAREGEVHLTFLDASHFVLQPFLCYVWSFTRIFLPAAAGRFRVNVLGTVDAITRKVVTLSNDTVVSQPLLLEFFKKLRASYSDGKRIVVVLDNARYQKTFMVQQLAKSMGIDLLYLPPYSPNLNLIERMWKLAKAKVLAGKFYADKKSFRTAIDTFFQDINAKWQENLDSLITLKFHLPGKSIPLIYP